MFVNQRLERSFILKHTLRSDEADSLDLPSRNITKLIIPFDVENLSGGGRYVIVGAPGWQSELTLACGTSGRDQDVATLRHLDRLPSFDPFLLRGWFEILNQHPSDHYFQVPASDWKDIHAMSLREMSELVALSLGSVATDGAVDILVRKMMNVRCGAELAGLRNTLQIEESKFEECMFCWRGFLFYKWMLARMKSSLPTCLTDMSKRTASAGAAANRDRRLALEKIRVLITRKMISSCDEAARTLKEYDEAYKLLVAARNPGLFRDFLLGSPAKFVDIGQCLGSVMHIIQFWAFNTSNQGARRQGYEDLEHLFKDFADSLGLL